MNELYVLNRIIEKRKESGFNKTQMAIKLGVSQGTYQKLEAGKSGISISRLIEIAKVLNVNPSYFLLSPEEKTYPILTHPEINTELKDKILELQKDIDVLDKSNDLLTGANDQLKTLNRQTNLISKACYDIAEGIFTIVQKLFDKSHEKEEVKFILQGMGLPVTDDNVSAFISANKVTSDNINSQLRVLRSFLDSMKDLVSGFPKMDSTTE